MTTTQAAAKTDKAGESSTPHIRDRHALHITASSDDASSTGSTSARLVVGAILLGLSGPRCEEDGEEIHRMRVDKAKTDEDIKHECTSRKMLMMTLVC